MQNQLSGQMPNQIGGSINGMQTNMPQQMNQISSGQMGPAQVPQQLNHMQRKVRGKKNTFTMKFINIFHDNSMI